MSARTTRELLIEARESYGIFGKPERALNLVDNALAQQSDNVEALNLKAAILYELDRDNEADEYHRRALAADPCSVEALQGLAALANDRKTYREALEWIERGFDCIPQDTYPEFVENEDYRQRLIGGLYTEKAFALWYLGRRDDARRLLQEDGPAACPLEEETFADELEWLEENPEDEG